MTEQTILDCGHPADGTSTYQGKPAWQFVVDFDGVTKICHACADKRILDCGHTPSPHSDYTTGYGKDSEGRTFCYACCAERDREAMINTGRATLYLVTDSKRPDGRAEVTNWPGSMRHPVYALKRGRHNIAGRRYDFDFVGPDGHWWHGTQYGDNTQIAHCKRTRARAA